MYSHQFLKNDTALFHVEFLPESLMDKYHDSGCVLLHRMMNASSVDKSNACSVCGVYRSSYQLYLSL